MKKIIIILSILILATSLFGQEKERQRNEAMQRLELSDDQSAQLDALKEKYRPEIQSIRRDAELSRSEKLRATADMLDQKEDDLKGILSQEQYSELSEIKRERKIARERQRIKMRARMRHRRN